MPSPHLERKLKEALGDDAGQELAAVTDRIDPIRGDIAELRHVMLKGFASIDARFASVEARMDARFASVEARFSSVDARFSSVEAQFSSVDARFSTQEAKTEAAIRKAVEEQTRFFFVAWAAILAAIVGLYGTVIALVR